jgi:hypothetical protein
MVLRATMGAMAAGAEARCVKAIPSVFGRPVQLARRRSDSGARRQPLCIDELLIANVRVIYVGPGFPRPNRVRERARTPRRARRTRRVARTSRAGPTDCDPAPPVVVDAESATVVCCDGGPRASAVAESGASKRDHLRGQTPAVAAEEVACGMDVAVLPIFSGPAVTIGPSRCLGWGAGRAP